MIVLWPIVVGVATIIVNVLIVFLDWKIRKWMGWTR